MMLIGLVEKGSSKTDVKYHSCSSQLVNNSVTTHGESSSSSTMKNVKETGETYYWVVGYFLPAILMKL